MDPHLYRLRGVPGLEAAVTRASLLLWDLLEGRDRLVIVSLDVGSRVSPARPGGLALLKHAETVVVVEASGGGVRARIEDRFASRPPLGPLLLLGAGGRIERVRQAARYLLELGRVLHLMESVEDPLIVYKHGPLVELLPVYLHPVYNADERLYLQTLLHAGLERHEADDIIGSSVAGDAANPGLAALELLRRIAGLNERRDRVAVGVVEDTSSSRLLLSQLLFETVLAATRGSIPPPLALGDSLASLAERGFEELRAYNPVDHCFSRIEPLDRQVFEDLAARIYTRLVATGGSLGVEYWRLAAAVYQESSILELFDSDILLTAYYLRGGVATDAFLFEPVLGLSRLAARQRLPGHQRAEEILSTMLHLSSYAVPGVPPSCDSLERFAAERGLGVHPELLAGLVNVPLPLRLDTVAMSTEALVEVATRLEGAAALALLSGASALYKLPPWLIEADVRSRVRLDEALILAEVARRIAGRLVPYGLVLRHWPRRRATV